jgi:hypothetical protein
MANRRTPKQLDANQTAKPKETGGPRHRMHEIQGWESLGARHIVYVRELEVLATECEEHVMLLSEVREKPEDTVGTADAIKYVMQRMQNRLDAIYRMSKE